MPGFASSTTTITFSDLTPGDELELSIEFHYGSGGSHGAEEGFSKQFVQSDGAIHFVQQTSFITRGHQGTAKAWLRPAGSLQTAPPVDYTTGPDAGKPAEITFHLP